MEVSDLDVHSILYYIWSKSHENTMKRELIEFMICKQVLVHCNWKAPIDTILLK